MVRQVEIISVFTGDIALPVAPITVPADEVHHVPEIIPVGTPVPGIPDIDLPGFLQGLGVTIGGRGTGPGNKAEEFGPGGNGVGLKP